MLMLPGVFRLYSSVSHCEPSPEHDGHLGLWNELFRCYMYCYSYYLGSVDVGK